MDTRKRAWSLPLVALLFPLLLGVTTVEASTDCSLRTLKGSYGYFEQGTIVQQLPGLPLPGSLFASSGIATYDGNGNSSGKGTTSWNGVSVQGTSTGTYTVNPDCTFSGQFTNAQGRVFHYVGTMTGGGAFQELHYTYTDPFLVGVRTLKKTPPEGCSLATAKGTYALFGQGTVTSQLSGLPPPPFPWADAGGIVTFDGNGSFSGKTTESPNGTILPITVTGTYTVNPDCSGSAEIHTSLGFVLHEAGAITGTGILTEFHTIITDAGAVYAETLKKQ
jgi:hypothetical protein